MKRNPQDDPRKKAHSQHQTTGSTELDGWVSLGKKDEALRLARQQLKNPIMSGDDFQNSLSAILTVADQLRTWTPLVESAYARLSKRDRRAARFWMLSFHCCNCSYERASRFIPRRFDGFPVELAFAMGTMLELGNMAGAKTLAGKLPRAIQAADTPTTQAMLMDCLAEYLVRKGEWNEAIRIWETVQLDPIKMESGVVGIMEIHAARALQSTRAGLQLVEKAKMNFDADLETTLPGNEKVRWAQTEKKLRRFEKMLQKILPEKRRKEMGIDRNR